MTKKLVKLSPEDVTGIAGYRKTTNEHYEPYFSADLPSNWILEEYPMVASRGHWISLKGPVNQSQSRHTSLDIYLIEREDVSKHRSLDAFVKYMKEQESIGDTKTIFDREVTINNYSAWEVKLESHRTLNTASGIAELTLIKQWTTIILGDHFFVIMYESPQEDFETYYDAYERFLTSLQFL